MLEQHQSIRHPFGVTTFGSALIRVDPDVASLRLAVTRIDKRPKEAFASTAKAAKDVRDYLTQARIEDVSVSRMTLSQKFQYSGGETRFIGYAAEIGFHILLTDLGRVEEVLIGVVEAGANEVRSVSFQTRRLKGLRAEARQKAVNAAREKTENYAAAAGVRLGAVLHIEDINPEVLTGRQEGHVVRQVEPDDAGDINAFNPGAITIGGAVQVAFAILAADQQRAT